jgi:acetyltransferase-like isoleucine patch superfamily enzyme
MIIRILEKVISRLKGYEFKFDFQINNTDVFVIIYDYLRSVIRGLLVFQVKKNGLIFIGKNCKFKFKSRIRIGKNLKLGDYCYLSAFGNKGIIIGDNVSIGNFGNIIVSTTLNNIGKGIEIGSNVGIGEFCYLGGAGGLKIGNDTIIGQYFSTHPENHNFSNSLDLIRKQSVSRVGIVIGSNCWIGAGVRILDGVQIGSNSVVAAGAIVNKSFPANSLIGGVPAKLIKSI